MGRRRKRITMQNGSEIIFGESDDPPIVGVSRPCEVVQTDWGPVELTQILHEETPGLISQWWFGVQVSVKRRKKCDKITATTGK